MYLDGATGRDFMFGVFPLNKPAGWSSRAAVNRVESLVRPAKAGHAGTLDPLAEGVLVVCVGPATRLIEYVQAMPKEYLATFLLGRRSDSDDVETEVTLLEPPPITTLAEIEAVLPRFRGTIAQRPPAFSAVKIDGQRAYKIARRGRAVETPLREVQIFELTVERFEYPLLVLRMRCSGGTYVRSVGRDLAHALGTSAVMSELVRTAVGQYSIADAHDPRGLDAARLQRGLLSPLTAVCRLAQVTLSAAQVEHVRCGGIFATMPCASQAAEAAEPGPVPASPGELRIPAESPRSPIAALDDSGQLVAILKEARPGWLKPSPNFLQME